MSELRIQDAAGTGGKILAVRALPDTDLIEGIEAACKKNNVKYAYVSCLGSLKSTGYMIAVPKPEAKIGMAYGDMIKVEGPIEILSCAGTVCQRDGAYDCHIHAAMSDKTGKVLGGHIVKGQNPTWATLDIMIFEVKDAQLQRRFDDETELNQFYPVK
jgi:predicted DNA-binding protein with PD1-like motif